VDHLTILAELIIPLQTLDVLLLRFWFGYILAWGLLSIVLRYFFCVFFCKSLCVSRFPPALRVDLDHKALPLSAAVSLPWVRCRGQAGRWDTASCKV
jgi:hypothetical protein